MHGRDTQSAIDFVLKMAEDFGFAFRHDGQIAEKNYLVLTVFLGVTIRCV